MATPTPGQHDKFRKLVKSTAEGLIGQSREDVMAKIEEINKTGDLEAEVGGLRSQFRQAVLQELERETNKLRNK
jgi:hypothetical protein